jgi:hypothetical protein
MINENALRDSLCALAQQSKTLYVMQTSVLNEVAAIRETVRGLDPTFADVIEGKRIEAARAQVEAVKLQLAVYDHIIERLKNGEVC